MNSKKKLVMLVAAMALIIFCAIPAFAANQVNVVDKYGIDKTGKKDCTSTIAKAIKENEGGTIYFPAGTYKVVGSISLTAKTEMKADKKAVFNFTGSEKNPVILKSNSTLDGGKYVAKGDYKQLIRVMKDKNVKIYNCSVSNPYGNGIKLDRSTGISIKGCTITGSGSKKSGPLHGVAVNDNSSATIYNTVITGSMECGVSVSATSSCTFSGKCKVNNNTRHGVGTTQGCKVTVKGSKNQFNGNKRNGISITSKCTFTATNAECKGNKEYGVSMNSTNSSQKVTATMTSCTLSSNTKSGIYVTNGNVTADKCTFNSNKAYGAFINKGSYVKINNSTISKNKGSAGLYVTAGGKIGLSKDKIQQNQIGISFNGGGKMKYIKSCTITNNKKTGIYYAGASKVGMKKNTIQK